jgi:hypothetical protein
MQIHKGTALIFFCMATLPPTPKHTHKHNRYHLDVWFDILTIIHFRLYNLMLGLSEEVKEDNWLYGEW